VSIACSAVSRAVVMPAERAIAATAVADQLAAILPQWRANKHGRRLGASAMASKSPTKGIAHGHDSAAPSSRAACILIQPQASGADGLGPFWDLGRDHSAEAFGRAEFRLGAHAGKPVLGVL